MGSSHKGMKSVKKQSMKYSKDESMGMKKSKGKRKSANSGEYGMRKSYKKEK